MDPITDSDLISRFNSSYQRCTGNDSFMLRFYQLFVSRSPEIAAKFTDTDMEQQARMIRVSLMMLLQSTLGDRGGLQHMERISKVHSHSGIDIPPPMYDIWQEALLEAVQEYDPEYTDEVGAAWRAVLAPGIRFMKKRY